MKLEEFTLFLITNITKESDLAKVKMFNTEDGVILEVLVSNSDMPYVIGKQGRVVNSIKDLIRIKAYNEGIKNIKINIDSF